jgi:hypothetical protein
MPIGRHTCVDCQTQSPETELTYSLIALAGWREQHTTDAAGATKVEWRCPSCWRTYKKRTLARTMTNLPVIQAPSDPRRKP